MYKYKNTCIEIVNIGIRIILVIRIENKSQWKSNGKQGRYKNGSAYYIR